jgi:hypothetical protein
VSAYPRAAFTGGHNQGPRILRPFHPASWFHAVGIWKVLARLKPKLPDVAGMLFLTFTFDQALFADPSAAFEHGRDHLRRMFHRLRQGVEWEGKTYRIDAPYCVKVEFHANGWAHFHVVLMTRRYLPGGLLNELWGLGRTNVRRINNHKFHYLLKYVTKGGGLPEWVLGRKRLRVFQTSRGFYQDTLSTGAAATGTRAETPATEASATGVPSKSPPTGIKRKTGTLGERLARWRTSALLQQGTEFLQINLCAPFSELLDALILPVALDGRYLGNGHIIINDNYQLLPWINPKSN